MNFTLKRKIIALAIFSVIIPVLIMIILTLDFQGILTQRAEDELENLVEKNIEQITKDVYGLCETANDLIQRKIDYDLNVARKILNQHGKVSLGRETVEWDAKNQFNNNSLPVRLPKLFVGKTWLGKNNEFSRKSPIVDDVKELVGGTCTIFQKMNEQGDMLRVATNVEKLDHTRAIGTYIPAINPDGKSNPVITTVLSGNPYRGLAYVVNAWYLTAYEPINDMNGKILGVLYVGERLESVESLRKTILNIQVGKTGYVWVLHGTGKDKGTYIVSKNGERDGENILDKVDADGNYFVQTIIQKALLQKNGEVLFQRYPWKDTSQSVEKMKKSSYTYFEPWDWVIGAGIYEEDYNASKQHIKDVMHNLVVKLALYGIIIVCVAVFSAYYLGKKMTKPLDLVINLAKQIASGNVHDVKNDLSAITSQQQAKSRNKYFLKNIDETTQLLEAFDTMTNSLHSLIGQVHRSGIQVTTSATEISASIRQLQATVTEQAASTKEVSATSKEISGTSVDLVFTIDGVNDSVSETASMADFGRSNLNNMESVMQRLIKATGSISSKLADINTKTNKISSVGTTINKISDQTHLLSLNAAIEAEKAGEYGKGFSVVAREINRLSDQTSVATQEIEYMVKEMQSSVSSGVMEMEKFDDEVKHGVAEIETISDQLGGIIDQVKSLGPQFEIVKEGMHTQEQGAQQISEAIEQLSQTAEQTKESLEEFKQATDQLNEAVQGLQNEASHFKISS